MPHPTPEQKPVVRVEKAATLLGDGGSPVYRTMKATAFPLPISSIGEGDHHRRMAADLISVPEAARHIGLHADTLYRLCRTGQFPPALQIGTRWRVSVPRLERYLHGNSTDS